MVKMAKEKEKKLQLLRDGIIFIMTNLFIYIL